MSLELYYLGCNHHVITCDDLRFEPCSATACIIPVGCALWRDSVILAVERVYTPGARLVGGLSLPSSLYTYLHTLYIYYLIQIHLRGFGVLGFWEQPLLPSCGAPLLTWRCV